MPRVHQNALFFAVLKSVAVVLCGGTLNGGIKLLMAIFQLVCAILMFSTIIPKVAG